MRDLNLDSLTLDSASRVTVKVDEKVVALFLLLFKIAAAFQSKISFVLNVKVFSSNFVSVNDGTVGTQVAVLVEMPGGSDEDICDFLHVG